MSLVERGPHHADTQRGHSSPNRTGREERLSVNVASTAYADRENSLPAIENSEFAAISGTVRSEVKNALGRLTSGSPMLRVLKHEHGLDHFNALALIKVRTAELPASNPWSAI